MENRERQQERGREESLQSEVRWCLGGKEILLCGSKRQRRDSRGQKRDRACAEISEGRHTGLAPRHEAPDRVLRTTASTQRTEGRGKSRWVTATGFELSRWTWWSIKASLMAEMVKNTGDPGFTPGLGRSPGEGNGYPRQYSCLGNPTEYEWARPLGWQRVGHSWEPNTVKYHLCGSKQVRYTNFVWFNLVLLSVQLGFLGTHVISQFHYRLLGSYKVLSSTL